MTPSIQRNTCWFHHHLMTIGKHIQALYIQDMKFDHLVYHDGGGNTSELVVHLCRMHHTMNCATNNPGQLHASTATVPLVRLFSTNIPPNQHWNTRRDAPQARMFLQSWNKHPVYNAQATCRAPSIMKDLHDMDFYTACAWMLSMVAENRQAVIDKAFWWLHRKTQSPACSAGDDHVATELLSWRG